jgi:hypothetical protein
MFVERYVSYSRCKQKMTSFRGQGSWAKMMSPRVKLTSPACHPTKRVNKAEELTYLSTNIGTTQFLTIGTSKHERMTL